MDFIQGYVYYLIKPPVIENLPASTEISEDVNVETQLYVLTVTDASLADTVTCSITNVSPALAALYLRYATGTSSMCFIRTFLTSVAFGRS